MNEYELIYEELCERVECGELTLEEAEIINDVAYDKYVKEANIYDKIIDKHASASDRYGEKLDKIHMFVKCRRIGKLQLPLWI